MLRQAGEQWALIPVFLGEGQLEASGKTGVFVPWLGATSQPLLFLLPLMQTLACPTPEEGG